MQYTPNGTALVDECRRVLKPGGEAVFQVYNRVSWLNALSKLMKVPLEHEDAPVLARYSASEFRALLTGFRDVRIVDERFPVKSRLHGGWKGVAFNTLFVGTFNALPAVARAGASAGTCSRSAANETDQGARLGNDFLLVAADRASAGGRARGPAPRASVRSASRHRRRRPDRLTR